MKKHRNMLFGLIFSLVIVFSSIASPVQASEDISAVRHSVAVVEIGIQMEGSWIDLGWGTGFFVGDTRSNPEYLLTNNHVIASYVNLGSGDLFQNQFSNIDDFAYTLYDNVSDSIMDYINLIWGEDIYYSGRAAIRVYFDTNDYVEAYLTDTDSIKDIALLNIAQPTDKRSALKLHIPDDNMVGKTIYTVGYPGLAENIFINSVSSWTESDATVNSGIISRLSTTSGTGVSTIQTDAVIMSGNSGGPMVDQSGAVVGINTMSVRSDSDQIYYAININEAISMLKLHDVPYVVVSAGSNVWLIVGIIAAALIIALVIIVLVRRKNKKSEVRNPEQAANVAAGVSTDTNGPDSGYRIQGVSGVLSGKRFMIRMNRPLTLGRDAAGCDVSFPANTAGVSGRHLKLEVSGGQLYVQDLNSSHGTFVDGRKLKSGERARVDEGSRIWLGTEKECVVIARKQVR